MTAMTAPRRETLDDVRKAAMNTVTVRATVAAPHPCAPVLTRDDTQEAAV